METDKIIRLIKLITGAISVAFLAVVLILGATLLIYFNPDILQQSEEIAAFEPTETIFEAGIHIPTGLLDGEHLQIVINNCTSCHSAQLITQNRATREGWKGLIRWMQKTQNLWDLGENEDKILDYLSTHYAPEKKGRRQNLNISEWYVLEP